MRTMLAVPTRSRAEMVSRNLSLMDVRPIYFVEPRQVTEYEEAIAGRTEFRVLGKNDGGIGYARQQIVLEAADAGYDYVIMSDDDKILPENIWDLAEAVDELNVSGCAAWQRTMKHLLGIHEGTGAHAHSGSLGSQIYAMSVDVCSSVGNYDPLLTAAREDDDMKLRAIQSERAPWAIHSDVAAVARGARGQDGGVASIVDAGTKVEKSIRRFAEKHSDYVSVTDKGFTRINWKRAYADVGLSYPLELVPRKFV